MDIIWIPIIEFIIGLPIAMAVAELRKKAEQKRVDAGTEKDKEGVVVRSILYGAYRALIRKHTPSLYRLTACLSKLSVPPNVALYALRETEKAISEHYDTRPIKAAIEAIEGVGE